MSLARFSAQTVPCVWKKTSMEIFYIWSGCGDTWPIHQSRGNTGIGIIENHLIVSIIVGDCLPQLQLENLRITAEHYL